jgi:hypothetical protein
VGPPVGVPMLAAPGVAWGAVAFPTGAGGSAGRGVEWTGFAPSGLLPELPPLTPGLEMGEGALSPDGALAREGSLSLVGALSFEGALARLGALSPDG